MGMEHLLTASKNSAGLSARQTLKSNLRKNYLCWSSLQLAQGSLRSIARLGTKMIGIGPHSGTVHDL